MAARWTKDGQLVFLGGSYDFEVVQVFAEAQYFKHQTAAGGYELGSTDFGPVRVDPTDPSNSIGGSLGLKGYGLHLGAAAPLGAGTLTAGLYYVDFSEEFTEEPDADAKYYGVSARYNYPLSNVRAFMLVRVMARPRMMTLATRISSLRSTAVSSHVLMHQTLRDA